MRAPSPARVLIIPFLRRSAAGWDPEPSLGSSRCARALLDALWLWWRENCEWSFGAAGIRGAGSKVFSFIFRKQIFQIGCIHFSLGNWKLLCAHSFSQPDLIVSTRWTSCTLKSADVQSCPQRSLSSAFTKLQGIPVCIPV